MQKIRLQVQVPNYFATGLRVEMMINNFNVTAIIQWQFVGICLGEFIGFSKGIKAANRRPRKY